MNHRKVTKPKWRRDRPVHPARIMTSQQNDPRDFDSEFTREAKTKALRSKAIPFLVPANNQNQALPVPGYGADLCCTQRETISEA